MPFCKYCGSAHDADAAFCTECGKPIARKTSSPKKAKVEVPLSVEHEQTVRVENGRRPHIPGDPITPEMKEHLEAYQMKVAQYTCVLAVLKPLFRDKPELFGEAEWKKVEEALAQRYGLPDNSVLRQRELPDFSKE